MYMIVLIKYSIYEMKADVIRVHLDSGIYIVP